MDNLSEAKVAESANASAIAHEALVNAQAALLKESESRLGAIMSNQIRSAINDAFYVSEDGRQKKFIDITRIPVICRDIADIKNTLWWTSRIASVVGMVVLALICALIATIRIHL